MVGGHLEIFGLESKEIVILLNGTMAPEEIRSAKLEDEVMHLLSHEVTHAAEAKYIRGATGDRRGKYVYDSKVVREYAQDLHLDPYDISTEVSEAVVYYNHSAEVRAYGQQIVREVLASTQLASKPSAKFIERVLDLRSSTWQRIGLHLTERNRSKIRLMVWRALSERRES